MVYAFAEKIMPKSKELQDIKEVVLMTRLGQMIFDDGLEQGRGQGIAQGIEQGITQGIEQGRDQMAALTRHLLQENRLDDL